MKKGTLVRTLHPEEFPHDGTLFVTHEEPDRHGTVRATALATGRDTLLFRDEYEVAPE